ncbi:MAG: hypothetical protein EXR58_08455 [Chloroflexi bacterium]|nr:hypothetical protein [Chloroflexota bacterium]
MPIGILLAGFAGLSDLLGAALVLRGGRIVSVWFDYILAYGTGFALSIALAELIPSGLAGGGETGPFWVLAGFSTLYLVDKLLEGSGEEVQKAGRGIMSGLGITIVGVAICDFFDGFAVASVVTGAAALGATEAAESTASGWLLLAGLFPHNFLEGASITLLLLGAGMSRGSTWVLVILLGLSSLLGGFAVQMAIPVAARAAVQAFAGGLLLHLVASERIPSFEGKRAKTMAILVVAGIITFVATELLISGMGLEGGG